MTLRILTIAAIVVILTTLTQVGGMIFLLSWPLYSQTKRLPVNQWLRLSLNIACFTIIYMLFTFSIIPPLALHWGRVPLPIRSDHGIKPATIWTCLLNRNYVTPTLKKVAFQTAKTMHTKFPGTTINYLDAGFPFIDGFPLPPHLSHNDGRKLDISLQYKKRHTGEFTNAVPSFIGYGVCEGPQNGEYDMPATCDENGYWQYNLLSRFFSQDTDLVFDPNRTRYLINTLSKSTDVKKIFIEPHLKTRLNLNSNKVRFHGCQAVRHDDHIHIQL